MVSPKRGWRAAALAGVVLLVAVLLLALAAPLLPLPGTVSPEQLAGSDGHFAVVSGISVHYEERGAGEPAVVLLHGFGASTFSWREVAAPLSESCRVLAFDRPGFGLTERPLPGTWASENPYSLHGQAILTLSLLDALGIEKAVLVGHSAGGAVAIKVALLAPERVSGLVLVSAAVYEGGSPAWAQTLARLPLLSRLGPLAMRAIALVGDRALVSAWHNPSRVTADVFEGYRLPLRAERWDVGLWELVRADPTGDLPSSLASVRQPALVIYGAEDTWVAPALSRRLADDLPRATLVAIEDCGHLPHEEQPAAFLAATEPFLEAVSLTGAD